MASFTQRDARTPVRASGVPVSGEEKMMLKLSAGVLAIAFRAAEPQTHEMDTASEAFVSLVARSSAERAGRRREPRLFTPVIP